MLSLYQICSPKADLVDPKGTLISANSQVVVLAINGKKITVCRYGFYLDSVTTTLDLLKTVR